MLRSAALFFHAPLGISSIQLLLEVDPPAQNGGGQGIVKYFEPFRPVDPAQDSFVGKSFKDAADRDAIRARQCS
jgi:hypothetical protein